MDVCACWGMTSAVRVLKQIRLLPALGCVLLLAGCGDSTDPPIAVSTTVTPISVSVAPTRTGITATQRIPLSAATNDSAGVTWSVSPSGGVFSALHSLSGDTVTFTAPATAGVYTVTARSVTGPASATATVAVTDLAGVFTYHNGLARDGSNDHEYVLTPANVASGAFGKLFACVTDGAIYAQPLWVAQLMIGGSPHNTVFAATEHDGLFAFDADRSPCQLLWSVSLIDLAHGAIGAESTVPSAGLSHLVGNGAGTITPETGVTGTPVIDPATSTLYVVAKSMDSTGTNFYQRLHAIDLATGNEKSGSPVTIAATYPGTGDGGATVAFNAQQELQRPGLALVNGTVYIAWASHEDQPPYYGWIIAYTYNGSSFTQAGVLNVTPNVGQGGIWMSGAAPAADRNGRLYLLTGNGTFDANQSAPLPNNDYGDSLLQLTGGLAVSQYFTPSDEDLGLSQDLDFGSGGAAILVNLPPTSPVAHMIVGGGKDGSLYVLNRDVLGGYGDEGAWQQVNIGGPILSTAAFWNNYLYIGGVSTPLLSFQLDPSTALFSAAGTSAMSANVPFGRTPSVSGSAGTNGIVWTLNNSQVCVINTQSAAPSQSICGPAILEAYDATNLGIELWSSAAASADTAGNAVRNAVPTIANGKVYIGTRGNNQGGGYGSTTASGEVDVYGLK
jgi:hypothetical protein